jgi:GNAT superfamily N-acetyltransferase
VINFFKKSILCFLFPFTLMGMESSDHGSWADTDNTGNQIVIEWYKISTYKRFFELWEQWLLPVFTAAFADEYKILIDENYEIKEEYREAVKDFDEEEDLHEAIRFYKTNNGKSRLTILDTLIRNAREKVAAAKKQTLQLRYQESTLVVMAKNKENEILGFTAFHMKPEFKEGEVLLEPIAVLPSAQGRGLARKLVFSILTLKPETTRIFLGTNIWLRQAQDVYKRLGFSAYEESDYSIKFEYINPNPVRTNPSFLEKIGSFFTKHFGTRQNKVRLAQQNVTIWRRFSA